MSLMSTVKPPLTLPLMTPVTASPSSKAVSRQFQALALFAFSRERPGGAESVLHRVERDLDEVADRDLHLPVLVSELFDRDGRLGLQTTHEP